MRCVFHAFLRLADEIDQNRRVQFDSVRLSALVLGDINCDGLVNLLDIDPFITLLTTDSFNPKADISQDHFVDVLDVGLFEN